MSGLKKSENFKKKKLEITFTIKYICSIILPKYKALIYKFRTI